MNKKVYYMVMWFDGDIDIPMYPDDEDYDNTDFKQVKAFAKTVKGSRIDKVTVDVKTA